MPPISPKRRLPNGRLSRAKRAVDQQNDDNAKQSDEVQSIVLAQPHRRGNPDQLCESPLGRFILKYALKRELYDAGMMYHKARLQWVGGAWHGPSDEKHPGSGYGLSEELAIKIRNDYSEWFCEMVRASSRSSAEAVEAMAAGYEIAENVYMLDVISALDALGKATGKT